jgi:hypothetical protein
MKLDIPKEALKGLSIPIDLIRIHYRESYPDPMDLSDIRIPFLSEGEIHAEFYIQTRWISVEITSRGSTEEEAKEHLHRDLIHFLQEVVEGEYKVCHEGWLYRVTNPPGDYYGQISCMGSLGILHLIEELEQYSTTKLDSDCLYG